MRKIYKLPILGREFFHSLEHSVNFTHLEEKVNEFYKINLI